MVFKNRMVCIPNIYNDKKITNKLQKYQKSTCQGKERCDSISELSARQ